MIRRKLMLLLAFLFVLGGVVNAQVSRMTGNVTSAEDGSPVTGASVLVKGTTVGTITDIDGNFTITNVPSSATTLVVSFIGMQTQEVPVASTVNVVLQSDAQLVDEVIVVAYGTAKKSSFTGSASTVGTQTLEKRSISNVVNALEGNTSGVQVTSATGQPGEGASIRVRGFGSVNASSAPLYVVDGAVYNGNISDINPNDIESMTILKDAASTSLYGSSAGNGVVLITTKSGSAAGGSSVNLSITQGWNNRAYADYSRMGVDDYMVTTWGMIKGMRESAGDDAATAAAYASSNLMTLLASSGLEERYNPYKGVSADQIVTTAGVLNPAITGLKYGDDLDFEKASYGTGYRQEYNLSFSTKTDKSDTYASVGYLNENGYMQNTDFERYTGRLNYNLQATKWLKTGLNLGFTRTQSATSSATASSSSSYSNIQLFTRTMAPYYPVHAHNEDGAYEDAGGNATTNPADYQYDYANRLIGTYVGRDGLAEQLWNSRDYHRMNESGKAYITITPIEGLSLTANYSINNLDYRAKTYENPYVGDGTAGPGRLAIASTRTLTQTFNQIAQYNKNFGKHGLDVTLGHENYSYKYEYFRAMKVGETIHGLNDFGNFTSISSLSSYTETYRKEGYFGRVNYDYDDRYYASLSYRHDGSSRFSKDNRWGDFWSFGLSWRISQESWMKDISWISNLKLRASYGETGNDHILDSSGYSDYYPYQTLYGLGYTNGTEAGAYFTTIANPNLKWETQVSTDLGLEFGLWDNKLTGSIEWFQKDSKDLLFDVAQAYSQGVSSIVMNVGKVRNSGVEINLDYNVFRTKDWNLSVGANATFIKNKIITLPADMKEGYVSGSKKWMEGKSIYEFWLYQWEGVNPENGSGMYLADTDNYNQAQVDAGKVTASSLAKFQNATYTYNGKTVTEDYTYAKKDYSGASIPKVYGGFNFSLGWKDLTLSATFSYQLGGKILDSQYASLMSNQRYGNSISTDLAKAWKQPGDVTDVPRLDATSTTNTSWTQSYSTRWLTSSDYLNLRTINLSWQLPKSILNKVSIKNARLNFTCENVFMIKSRQGLNPMANFSGITYNEYMPSRNFTFGLNVGF